MMNHNQPKTLSILGRNFLSYVMLLYELLVQDKEEKN